MGITMLLYGTHLNKLDMGGGHHYTYSFGSLELHPQG